MAHASPASPVSAIPDATRMTAAALGRLFGVSAQAVGRWDCPRNPDRTYDLAAVIAWRVEQARDELSGVDPSRSQELERLRRIRADLAQLDLDRQRGNLVDVNEVGAIWGRMVTQLVQQLDGLGQILAPRLEGMSAVEIADAIRSEVRMRIDAMREQYAEASE